MFFKSPPLCGHKESTAAVISKDFLPSNPSFFERMVFVDRIRASGPNSSLTIFNPEAMSWDSNTLTCIEIHITNRSYFDIRKNLIVRDYNQLREISFSKFSYMWTNLWCY